MQWNCILLKVLLDFLCAPPRKGGGRRPFLQSKNALTMKIVGVFGETTRSYFDKFMFIKNKFSD